MAISNALAWQLNNGGSAETLYGIIRDFLATSPDAATTQAQMAQYGISGEDVANATGGASGGLLGGNILAGASWNSLNTALPEQLTAATGQATSNYAVGGATTADTLAQLNTFLAGGGQFDPNATVYLASGGVDFLKGIDKGTIKDNLNQIVQTLGAQGVNVVLTGSPYAKSIDDVINNNFDPKVDQLFVDVAKENKNVALVGIQGEILQNKALLIDALHTNAEGTSIYNQAVIDSLSQFKNEVPSSTPQAIAQVYQTDTVATTPPIITQAAANPPVAEALANVISTADTTPTIPKASANVIPTARNTVIERDNFESQSLVDAIPTGGLLTAASPAVAQTLATQSVDSLIKAGNLNPAEIAAATGVPIGEIITKAAALAPFQGSTKVGDTYVSPNYEITQSGEEQIVGGLQSISTSKVSSEQGSRTELYSPSGELTNVGKYDKGPSFFGGLADALNDPVVQAAFLGLGAGGALGNALNLTGSTAQAVGTGLLKGGAAAAGGASLEDALKTGLLSGGLVYGGNLLGNYLDTGSTADVGLTERQFAVADAKNLASQGLSTTQIADTLAAGGYNEAIINRAITAITPADAATPAVVPAITDSGTVAITAPTVPSLSNVLSTIAATTPVAVSTPVTDAGAVTVAAPKTTGMTTQEVINLVESQIASNVGTPTNLGTSTNLANVEVTGSTLASTQEITNAILATVPNVTVQQAQNQAEVIVTSGQNLTKNDLVTAVAAVSPNITNTVAEQIITSSNSNVIQPVVSALVSTVTPTTPTNLATVEVTGDRLASTQEIANAVIATVPNITPQQAQTQAEVIVTSGQNLKVSDLVDAVSAISPNITNTVAEQIITSDRPITNQELVTALTATIPAVTTPVTTPTTTPLATQTITAPKEVTVEEIVNAITATIPTVTPTQTVAEQVITSDRPVTTQEVINAITAAIPTVTTPTTVPTTTITADSPVVTPEIINAITAAIPSVTAPTTLPTTTITAPLTPTTVQDLINTITATVPTVIPTTPATVPTTTITANSPTTTQDVINTIAATVPAVIPTTSDSRVTITADRPSSITDAVTAATIPLIQPTTPLTVPQVTAQTPVDPLRVAQLGLTAAGLLGAGSALSSGGSTQFPIVPVPESWTSPITGTTGTIGTTPYPQLPAINFGDRNLLRGTQWEKFLNPNYGRVPAPVQYSQPSSLSYNDLMGILGSRQGMPPSSSLSINDIISGIQNQYGQTPVSTVG
jgi:hypothetical protein